MSSSSIAAMMCGSDVSAWSHRPSRIAPNRCARRWTWCALSSAVTYSVGPSHAASSWSSSVLLPMPGSPPSSVTDPGTNPPPSTRSSSSIEVAIGSPSWARTSPIGVGPGRWDGSSGTSAAREPSTSSTSVFQSPQPEHWPDHFGCADAALGAHVHELDCSGRSSARSPGRSPVRVVVDPVRRRCRHGAILTRGSDSHQVIGAPPSSR